ncbi:uncharacterized protein LOC112212110 isoform X2 [Bombus impatiens]|uniref:Uncharacterized protein LOC112212110 isoform X2 n=1 Tax=Bombus impatiens TaxID=132113 RepID=A0A6P8LHG2_BOMIM|nr:uncharacterized protein LOC112212110 isoform X2 [Bombus impatiens]
MFVISRDLWPTQRPTFSNNHNTVVIRLDSMKLWGASCDSYETIPSLLIRKQWPLLQQQKSISNRECKGRVTVT